MMEDSIFQLIALYSVYYLAIPGLIFLIIWKIKQEKDFIKALTRHNEDKGDKFSDTLRKNSKKLKNLQILLVIFILISMPVLNLTFHGLEDTSIRRSRDYSGRGYFPAHIDRVDEKIGPTFDSEAVIEQMTEAEFENWYLDDIREQVDLDEIFRLPGRVTVYRLGETMSEYEQIVINYAYLSPIPITRSIEFTIMEEKAFLETNRIIAYPIPPSLAAPS